jgi:hypothetical protein
MPSLHNGICPQDLFTRTRWPQARFHDLHVWGCPTYCPAGSLAPIAAFLLA